MKTTDHFQCGRECWEELVTADSMDTTMVNLLWMPQNRRLIPLCKITRRYNKKHYSSQLIVINQNTTTVELDQI